MAVHPSTGEVFVAGTTGSTDFPGTLGGAQQSQTGNGIDSCHCDPALTAVLQSTYLGGSGWWGGETVKVIAVHPSKGGARRGRHWFHELPRDRGWGARGLGWKV